MGVGDYDLQPFTSPVGADSQAWQTRNNDNLLRGKFVQHQADEVAHPTYGLDADKPTPPLTGMIYVATDTGVIYFYNGTTWVSTAAFRQYGAWQDTTNQTAAAANTAYAITYNTTDVTGGITLTSGSRLTVPMAGVYNLQFSASWSTPPPRFTMWTSGCGRTGRILRAPMGRCRCRTSTGPLMGTHYRRGTTSSNWPRTTTSSCTGPPAIRRAPCRRCQR